MTFKLLFVFPTILATLASISFIITEASPLSTHTYKVTVKTASNEFEQQRGNLKLSILFKNGDEKAQEDFYLCITEPLVKNHVYNSLVSSVSSFENITSVYLQWDLSFPGGQKNSQPLVYFDSIVLHNTITDPVSKDAFDQSWRFMPASHPKAIRSSDGASFYPWGSWNILPAKK